mmetsp:Transcript_23178/g.69166  ORF Transcript_23178/g.69166 Transcript_23178/m.69166 type:complete len:235 (+) Transcript_23178:323-1027(+)
MRWRARHAWAQGVTRTLSLSEHALVSASSRPSCGQTCASLAEAGSSATKTRTHKLLRPRDSQSETAFASSSGRSRAGASQASRPEDGSRKRCGRGEEVSMSCRPLRRSSRCSRGASRSASPIITGHGIAPAPDGCVSLRRLPLPSLRAADPCLRACTASKLMLSSYLPPCERRSRRAASRSASLAAGPSLPPGSSVSGGATPSDGSPPTAPSSPGASGASYGRKTCTESSGCSS